MTATLDEHTQFVDTSGAPVVGGSVFFGVAGSDPVLNPVSIFSDRELTVALANPQTTDSNGRVTNKVWVSGKYSLELQDSTGAQLYQELDNGTTSSGVAALLVGSISGANTITGAAASTITAYTDGQQFTFKTASINTGAVTLNIDSVGAKSIVKNVSKAILPGDFAANQEIIVVYNSTNDNFDWVNQKRLSNTFYEGAAIASAATTDVWAVDGDTLHITGTTGITSLGTAPNVGARKTLIFDGIVTLTNSANLALPGGVDYITAAGDVLEVYADTVTQLDVRVTKKDGTAAIDSPDFFASSLFHVRDEKASGTAGGGFTSGAFQTRTLNTTKTNEITGASLSSNVITLAAGTYYCEMRAPGNRVRGHKTRLRNTADSSTVIVGTSEESESVDFVSTQSFISGRFTLAASKTLELQHWCNTTRATDGFGHEITTGEVEVYAEVKIWKVA